MIPIDFTNGVYIIHEISTYPLQVNIPSDVSHKYKQGKMHMKTECDYLPATVVVTLRAFSS